MKIGKFVATYTINTILQNVYLQTIQASIFEILTFSVNSPTGTCETTHCRRLSPQVIVIICNRIPRARTSVIHSDSCRQRCTGCGDTRGASADAQAALAFPADDFLECRSVSHNERSWQSETASYGSATSRRGAWERDNSRRSGPASCGPEYGMDWINPLDT